MAHSQLPSPPIKEAYSHVVDALARHGIRTPHPAEVTAYLSNHADLAKLVPDLAERLRQEFSADTELSLEMYHDPEVNDEYLTFYVRQRTYASDVLARIEGVSESFSGPLADASGYVLVTTDFSRPKGPHAV